ncbi:hypothetical protein TcCL_ESM11510 [Trypanosoma cruzi]|nr:hypothetical protein TcCL_ESM11510 [Trypanosoma cruzi]
MSGDCAFLEGVYMRGTGIEQRGICGECRRLVGPRFGCPPKFMTFWASQRTLLFFVESCAITNDTLDCCVSPSFFFLLDVCELCMLRRELHLLLCHCSLFFLVFSFLAIFYFCCLFYFWSC